MGEPHGLCHKRGRSREPGRRLGPAARRQVVSPRIARGAGRRVLLRGRPGFERRGATRAGGADRGLSGRRCASGARRLGQRGRRAAGAGEGARDGGRAGRIPLPARAHAGARLDPAAGARPAQPGPHVQSRTHDPLRVGDDGDEHDPERYGSPPGSCRAGPADLALRLPDGSRAPRDRRPPHGLPNVRDHRRGGRVRARDVGGRPPGGARRLRPLGGPACAVAGRAPVQRGRAPAERGSGDLEGAQAQPLSCGPRRAWPRGSTRTGT